MEEFEAIEWLQAKIWGTALGVTPGIFLFIIAKEGGVVLLALDNGEPVGFNYGIIGLAEGNRVKLASHQTGVLPAYQDRGLGRRLKLVQRKAALAKNLDRITWTFDPLQWRNARLNLSKLGAVCNTYVPNLYGEMEDVLNQGLPSDRFNVDWWLSSEHVVRRLEGQTIAPDLSSLDCPVLNAATTSKHGFALPPDSCDLPLGQFCLVEVPTDIAILKRKAPDIALQWRLQTRKIFTAAFSTGYTAVDLLRRQGRNYYLLQLDWKLSSPEDTKK